jgi:hypothetical protein
MREQCRIPTGGGDFIPIQQDGLGHGRAQDVTVNLGIQSASIQLLAMRLLQFSQQSLEFHIGDV